MSDEAAPELHDRATSREYLTQEKPDVEQGESEMTVLRETDAMAERYSARPSGLSAADRRVALTLKRRLADLGPPIDFRVFGSRARGNATWESDLDIFIELEAASPTTRRRIEDLAWEVGFAAGVVISPFVVTREQLEAGPVGANPLIREIMSDGVVL
jgi:predicted nucleotidyltransferase